MVHLLDSVHLDTPQVICVAVIEAAPGDLVMIDCGPANVFENVVAELRKRGLPPEQVRQLFATHIHLDHNGGAWRWQREFGTIVYVHPKGAPHIVDPGRLVGSATRIYGDQMDYLWGPIEGIPENAVRVTQDGEVIRIGALDLQVFETPGHAQHHNVYWLASDRLLFAGDIAGVAIGNGPIFPPCPPPDIDIEAWRSSIARIDKLEPERLCLTHFGLFANPKTHLKELSVRLSAWAEWMKNALRAGKSDEVIVPEFQRFAEQEILGTGIGERGVAVYEQADPAAMSVTGLSRYWRKHHPDALTV
ncbi:MAG TPA: MBL fold metallo-hydrolase [Chthoniobacterales bacterium]|nr:MBL fold metallo-hydrolase [Chthoniobacterales bacterium]